MADRGSGIKLDSTMPRPEILLTEVWLGTRKKYTAAAMIATAAVRIQDLLQVFGAIRLLFFHLCPSKFQCDMLSIAQGTLTEKRICMPLLSGMAEKHS